MRPVTGLVLIALCCMNAPTSATEVVRLTDSDGSNYEAFSAETAKSEKNIQLFHNWNDQSETLKTSATLLAQKNPGAVQNVLADLLVWIGLHSSYSIDQIALPEVVELTPEGLTLEAYTDVPELLPASGVDERILGLYADDDGTNGTIYILQCSAYEYESEFVDYASGETCEEENLVFQERILHELIHHIQKVTGAVQRFTCRKSGEKEAYLLGGEFFKSHFFTDPLPNRYILAHMYSRC